MFSDIRNLAIASFIFLVCGCLGCGEKKVTETLQPSPKASPTTSLPTPPLVDARPKLVAIGDSFTSGYGIDDWRKNYPSLLQEDLDRAGYDLQVVNRGR